MIIEELPHFYRTYLAAVLHLSKKTDKFSLTQYFKIYNAIKWLVWTQVKINKECSPKHSREDTSIVEQWNPFSSQLHWMERGSLVLFLLERDMQPQTSHEVSISLGENLRKQIVISSSYLV